MARKILKWRIIRKRDLVKEVNIDLGLIWLTFVLGLIVQKLGGGYLVLVGIIVAPALFYLIEYVNIKRNVKVLDLSFRNFRNERINKQ